VFHFPFCLLALLDVLAGKKTGGTISGELLVNGLPRDPSFFRIAGYVEQFDSHNEKSTVREAVRFAAMLRLPANITNNSTEVEHRVTRTLEQLGLIRMENDLIGGVNTGGISQEARKKVTIAVELIGEPRILFLDEPTTGLSSDAALSVMSCVVTLSRQMAVLCTLHQPSEELISMFNFMCLLQPGGKTVYFGPLSTLAAHFASVGMAPYKSSENLADYAIQCAKSSTVPSGEKIDLQKEWLQSKAGKVTLGHLEKGIASKHTKEAWEKERELLVPHGHFRCLAPFTLQFSLLLRRFYLNLIRSPDLWFGRLFAQILMSFIIGTCFFRLGSNQADAQNRISCLFLTVQFVMGSGALKLPAIFAERAVVFRERQSSMYGVEAYYISRWVSDLPLWLVENLIFCVMVYFICGLTSMDHYARFGLFYLLVLLTAQMGFSLSELVALLSPTPASAYAVQGLVSTIFSLFSGFLIAHSNMPIGWSWAYFVSPNRYPLTAGIQNEMRGAIFTCEDNLHLSGPPPLCPNQASATFHCPVACGEQLLEGLGVSSTASDEAQNYGLIVVYFAGFKILGYFAFRFLQHIKR
jgi:ABC-type multidrug transport system ATPase subunit/ABC-type multidrug transport system permease subunit